MLSRVRRGSPAFRAGLRPGDRIVRFAGRKVRDGEDLRAVVMTARSPATLYLWRDERDEPLKLSVELDHEPVWLGLTWQTDAADPGGIILTHVIPRTPAAEAGLRPGDRIYRVAGRDIVDGDGAVLVRYYHRDDAKRLKWVIRKHDIEEFSGVVERHGPWRRDLLRLVDVL